VVDWSSLVGQEVPARILKRALRHGHVAHALLLEGEEGLGTEALAWVLARCLLCQEGGEEPCGVCPGCVKSARLDHPDLQVVLPLPSLPAAGGQEDADPAETFADDYVKGLQAWIQEPLLTPRPEFARDKESGAVRHRQIQVAQARALKKWAGLRAFESRHRVAILVEAERMGVQAQNALLKLLEEPPDQLVLLLCTSSPETLLPTILSRCQRVSLRPASTGALTAWLEARGVAEESGLEAGTLAQLAGGNPGRALRLAAERAEGTTQGAWDPAGFLRDLLTSHSDNLHGRLVELDASRDRERLRRFLGQMQTWLLDAELVRRLGGEARHRVLHADQFEDLERFAARVAVPRPDVVLERLFEAQRQVERNAHTFTLLLTLAHDLRRECAALGKNANA
jgi:DNA polymerase-3 subunit delta'